MTNLKGEIRTVNRKRTDNTMAKGKRTDNTMAKGKRNGKMMLVLKSDIYDIMFFLMQFN
jgi:hypothetical protein